MKTCTLGATVGLLGVLALAPRPAAAQGTLVMYCGVDEGWCRAMATRREDLSLLGNMTEKERAKCREKGITTLAQLSYGYRPRRRRHVKSTPQHGPPPVRHDHKLKALAIKKAQVHVVGAPDLSIEGTPVLLRV